MALRHDNPLLHNVISKRVVSFSKRASSYERRFHWLDELAGAIELQGYLQTSAVQMFSVDHASRSEIEGGTKKARKQNRTSIFRGRIANDAIKAAGRLGYRSGLENPCLSRYGPAVKGGSNG